MPSDITTALTSLLATATMKVAVPCQMYRRGAPSLTRLPL